MTFELVSFRFLRKLPAPPLKLLNNPPEAGLGSGMRCPLTGGRLLTGCGRCGGGPGAGRCTGGEGRAGGGLGG